MIELVVFPSKFSCFRLIFFCSFDSIDTTAGLFFKLSWWWWCNFDFEIYFFSFYKKKLKLLIVLAEKNAKRHWNYKKNYFNLKVEKKKKKFLKKFLMFVVMWNSQEKKTIKWKLEFDSVVVSRNIENWKLKRIFSPHTKNKFHGESSFFTLKFKKQIKTLGHW